MIKVVISLLIILNFYIQGRSQALKAYAPEIFPDKISGAVCGFSVDGSIIYFVREDTLQKKLFLYQAFRIDNLWRNEKLLSFSGKYNDYGGRLNHNKTIFYFTSDRPGGSSRKGDQWNLWFSRKAGDTWKSPQPLVELNEKGDECCPVPLPDGQLLFSGSRGKDQEWLTFSWNGKKEAPVLPLNDSKAWQWPSFFDPKSGVYFFNSMKRPDTFGKDDIYVAFFKNNKWAAVKNIGSSINTEIYEDGAILSADQQLLIFCRHATASTPSRVLCVSWPELLDQLK